MKMLPRLNRMQVDEIIQGLEEVGDNFLDAWDVVGHLNIYPEWNAAGGKCIKPDDEEFREFRNDIISVAEECGFPERGKQEQLRKFDIGCTRILADSSLLLDARGETLRDDCWACIASFILPGLTLWRYGLQRERFWGGVRNTFQRLWMRARILDRGPDHPERWLFVENLTEDAFVQIVERPGLAADPRLSKALANEWVKRSRGHGNMEDIMRGAAKRLLAINEVRMLSMLDTEELEKVVVEVFDRAVKAVTMSGNGESRIPA